MTAADGETADFTALAELAEAFAALFDALTVGTGARTCPRDGSSNWPRDAFRPDATPPWCSPRTAAPGAWRPRATFPPAWTGSGPGRSRSGARRPRHQRPRRQQRPGGRPEVAEFWARYRRSARHRSTVVYRLNLAPRLRAALVLYSDWPHAFDELAIATGVDLRGVLLAGRHRRQPLGDRLSARRAQEVHREIGVAAGLLMPPRKSGSSTPTDGWSARAAPCPTSRKTSSSTGHSLRTATSPRGDPKPTRAGCAGRLPNAHHETRARIWS